MTCCSSPEGGNLLNESQELAFRHFHTISLTTTLLLFQNSPLRQLLRILWGVRAVILIVFENNLGDLQFPTLLKCLMSLESS